MKMKSKIKTVLAIVATATITNIAYSQTPYDDFAPSETKKEMLKLPNATFKAYNVDSSGEISYMVLDNEYYTISYFNQKDSLLKIYYLEPKSIKWLSVDPKASKYPNASPYNFVNNNPIVNIDPDGQDWFYYQAQGQNEASWQWNKGSSVTYNNIDGNSVTLNNGYSNLVKFTVSGTNSEGAQYGNIQIWNQNKLELTSNYVFSGNNNYSSTPAADEGTYFMRLDIRDANGPKNMNADESNPEAAWGIQKIPQPTLIPTRNNPNSAWDINASYGNGRIRLIPSDEVKQNNMKLYGYSDRGLYLHGKQDSHFWTHGCVCDKTEAIFNYYWNGAGQNHRQKTPFVIVNP